MASEGHDVSEELKDMADSVEVIDPSPSSRISTWTWPRTLAETIAQKI